MPLSSRALFGGLVALAAPAVIRTPGLLMAVKPFRYQHVTFELGFVIEGFRVQDYLTGASRWWIESDGILHSEHISEETLHAA